MIHNPDILPAAASPPKEGAGSVPRPASSPTLSVVMIVRDEEENLPRCLESLERLDHDQLVVLDTGSTDRTMEIAREYDAEIHEQVIEPWDFAKARNLALQYVTSEWMLSIDADETLHRGAEALKPLLAKIRDDGTMGGAVILMEDMTRDGEVQLTWTVERVTRMKARPKWVGAYHNQLTHDGGFALLQGVVLRHYGYDLEDEAKEAKLRRTEEIILRDLQQNGPGDYRGYFYLAHQKALLQEPEAAMRYGTKYEENARKHPQFNASIYHLMIRVAISIGETDLAESWVEKAVKALPEDLDIAYDLVLYGQWRQRQDLVIEGGRRYMALYDQFDRVVQRLGNRWVYTYTPAEHAWVCRRVAQALGEQMTTVLDRHKRAVEAMGQKGEQEKDAISRELRGCGVNWTNQ